jgi:hypothetical protein
MDQQLGDSMAQAEGASTESATFSMRGLAATQIPSNGITTPRHRSLLLQAQRSSNSIPHRLIRCRSLPSLCPPSPPPPPIGRRPPPPPPIGQRPPPPPPIGQHLARISWPRRPSGPHSASRSAQ